MQSPEEEDGFTTKKKSPFSPGEPPPNPFSLRTMEWIAPLLAMGGSKNGRLGPWRGRGLAYSPSRLFTETEVQGGAWADKTKREKI